MMNTRDLLRPLIEDRGGVLLDWPGGELGLFDRLVRGVLPLPPSLEAAQQEDLLSLVDRLYSQGRAYALQTP
jgi:hypothetical protein